MRVVAYCRVSTKGQGDADRLGLPAQRAAISAFCRKNAHEIVAQFEDRGYSGATADRPGLAKVIDEAAHGSIDAVVVAKWDRLARDTTLDGYLRHSLSKLKVIVLSATEDNGVDPMAALTQTILAAVAQFERHLIRQRLLTARRMKRERGGYAEGRPRFGSEARHGSLVGNEVEKSAIRFARRLRRANKSYRDIAKAMDTAGIRTRGGKPWSASTVHGILKRRR